MSTAPLAGLGESVNVATRRRAIPFDVAFRYTLTGEQGRVHREIVTVSIEASFVAVSIGYGVIPSVESIRFGPPPVQPVPGIRRAVIAPTLRTLTIGDLIDGLAVALDDGLPGGDVGGRVATVLGSGIRLADAPRLAALLGGGNAPLDADTLTSLFQAVAAPANRVQFRYALFDDATGREFQSEPILNIAGLGSADGGRPFRYFARPVRFAPRSTIRLEITEESGFAGELHVSLQGYKVLGGASSPTGRAVRRAARALPRQGRRRRRPPQR
jgi:hypothetical protein